MAALVQPNADALAALVAPPAAPPVIPPAVLLNLVLCRSFDRLQLFAGVIPLQVLASVWLLQVFGRGFGC